MKKKLGLLALATVLSASAYSASIDHIQTYTPEYLGNQAQNGMINNTSVYYNPAGLMHLENGTYFHVGAQLAVGHEKMEYNGKDYEADLLQPIPNFALYSVRDNRAIFWTFGGMAGGGDLEYKDGVAGTAVVSDLLNSITSKLPLLPNGGTLPGGLRYHDNGSSAEGTNLYAQNTLGRAWFINDKLSVSVAGRVVLGMRNLKGDINVKSELAENLGQKDLANIHADIDSERTAWGFGAQLGFNYKVNEKLNLAMRYDSRVKLNFKASGDENTVNIFGTDIGFSSFYPEYTPGTKTRRDLPAILAAGASYKVTDNWTVALSGNYYFNKDAKMDRKAGLINIKLPTGDTKTIKGEEAEYDNGWELALGTEYKFSPKWAILGSINYADTGAKVTSYDDVEYGLNSITLGTGLKYTPNDSSEWVFAVSHFFYDAEKGHYDRKYSEYQGIDNPEYDKSITAFGVAYTKKF